MAQSTTNLGKIHVFPSESLYNQFKDIIADKDLALLKDDGAYIVAANLAQNGYVKFSNGLILQWGSTILQNKSITLNVTMKNANYTAVLCKWQGASAHPFLIADKSVSSINIHQYQGDYSAKVDWLVIGV